MTIGGGYELSFSHVMEKMAEMRFARAAAEANEK
jgi:hypothetical protein